MKSGYRAFHMNQSVSAATSKLRSRPTITAGTSLPGVGLYTVPEAARLTAIPSCQIRRWLFGYKHAFQEPERVAIVLDPGRGFGKPILAEFGIPTATLHQAITL